MKWRLVPEKREETIALANKNIGKAGGRTSSAPGSPAGAPAVSSGFPQGPPLHMPPNNGNRRSPPNAQSSGPPPSFPISSQQFMPSQASQPQTSTPPGPSYNSAAQLSTYGSNHGLPTLSDPTSPLQRHHHASSARLPAAVGDSSPVLNSFAVWNNPEHMTPGGITATPIPRVHNLNIPQPGTVRLPSSHMVESSPAPFWRFPDGFGQGSTPAKPATEASPQKVNLGGGIGNLQNSSSPPPPVNGGDGSPTRKSGSQRMASSQSSQVLESLPKEITIHRVGIVGDEVRPKKEEIDAEPEEEQIDLTK